MITKSFEKKITEYFYQRIQEIKAEYGYDIRYKVNFKESKTYVGLCRYATRTITISTMHAQHMDFEAIKDTVNHELAHAAVGPNHGHGEKWQKMAVLFGARPDTKCEVGEIKRKYLFMVGNKVVGTTSQWKSDEELKGMWMRGNKAQTYGRMRLELNPEYIDNSIDSEVEKPVKLAKPVKPINYSLISNFLSDM